ncbi:MAG TPA: hypothetical protein VFP84_07970 [Kofleriaceae bacterium]|nr:hypothetical protein [Kofleriaceae bacterium]
MPISNLRASARRHDPDHTESATDPDAPEAAPPPRLPTWRERHALKLLGGVMAACFALVIVAQTAC